MSVDAIFESRFLWQLIGSVLTGLKEHSLSILLELEGAVKATRHVFVRQVFPGLF